MSTIQDFEAAAAKATQASAQADTWANGPINTTVPTDSGLVPTIAEFTRANQERADNAIANFNPQIRESLRRSYAEAGYTLVAGSFEAGGTLTSASDVLLYEAEGRAYSWGGTLPKTVPVGSTPSSSGEIGSSAWTDKSGDNLRSQIAAPSLEFYGISEANTAAKNASLLAGVIANGYRIGGSKAAYTFDFAGASITYTGVLLDLDLGPWKHVFINFGGIVADNLRVLRYNGRFSANGGYCKGLIRARNLQLADIDVIEITDVFCSFPTAATQFFAIEYSSGSLDDNTLVFNARSVIAKNIITQTTTNASGTAVPMTFFGNFGSSSSQSKRHILAIESIYAENFYSVSSDGTTIIDGDCDFFRLFTNPTQVTIGTLTSINVGKRFIKTQEAANVVIANIYASLDSRFTIANFIGFLEGQAANSNIPSRFTILKGVVDFSASTSTTPGPLLCNASGLPHEFFLRNLTYYNCGAFSSDQNILLDMEHCRGSGFASVTTASSRIRIKDFVDMDFDGIQATACHLEDFTLKIRTKQSSFPLNNATLVRGKFVELDVDTRVAVVRHINNVELTYTTGTVARRPFRPVSSGHVIVNGLTVNSLAGFSTQTFESPGGSGEMTIRDYRSTTQTLAFFSSGTWSFMLDNCSDSTVTGVGAVSVKSAQYI